MDYANNGTFHNYFNNTILNISSADELDKKIKAILKEIIEGLIYIHNKNIIHMDIKSHNILMFDDTPIISDFGTCIIKEGRFINRKMQGTPSHIAPEIILNSEYYDEKCDVWSFGCMMCELLKINIFQLKANMYEIMNYLAQLDKKNITIECNNLVIKNFIEKCFQYDTKTRASFDELLKDIIFETNDLSNYIIYNIINARKKSVLNYSLQSTLYEYKQNSDEKKKDFNCNDSFDSDNNRTAKKKKIKYDFNSDESCEEINEDLSDKSLKNMDDIDWKILPKNPFTI
jgi:serine/threonine protein kinase